MTRMAPVRYTRRRRARRTSGALLSALGACALVAALALVLGALAPTAAPAASGGSGEPATSDARGDWRLGSVPRLYQTDPAWADEPYAGGTVRENGCGPTCLSMVYVALTGRDDLDPAGMAAFSERGGYVSDGMTTWSLMTDGAAELGLDSEELPADEGTVRDALAAGRPVICSVRPGDFTTTGHFIVLAGIAEDGSVIVRDPNSAERTARTWDLQRVIDQCANLWAFSVA